VDVQVEDWVGGVRVREAVLLAVLLPVAVWEARGLPEKLKDCDSEGCVGVCVNDADGDSVAAAEPELLCDLVYEWVPVGEDARELVELQVPVLDGLQVEVRSPETVAVGVHDLVGAEGVGLTVVVGEREPVWLALKVAVDVQVTLGGVAVSLWVSVPVPVGECTVAVAVAVVGVRVPREGENEVVDVQVLEYVWVGGLQERLPVSDSDCVVVDVGVRVVRLGDPPDGVRVGLRLGVSVGVLLEENGGEWVGEELGEPVGEKLGVRLFVRVAVGGEGTGVPVDVKVGVAVMDPGSGVVSLQLSDAVGEWDRVSVLVGLPHGVGVADWDRVLLSVGGGAVQLCVPEELCDVLCVEVWVKEGTALGVAVRLTVRPSVAEGVWVSVAETLREVFRVADQDHVCVWLWDRVGVGLCVGGDRDRVVGEGVMLGLPCSVRVEEPDGLVWCGVAVWLVLVLVPVCV